MSRDLHMPNQDSRVRWHRDPFKYFYLAKYVGQNTNVKRGIPAEFSELLAMIDRSIALYVHRAAVVLAQIITCL